MHFSFLHLLLSTVVKVYILDFNPTKPFISTAHVSFFYPQLSYLNHHNILILLDDC